MLASSPSSSPRPLASPSRARRTPIQAGSKLPIPHSSYANAATQYSPVSPRARPAAVRESPMRTSREQIAAGAGSSGTAAEPVVAPVPQPRSESPVSPMSRRRQHPPSEDAGRPSTSAQASAPKRVKPARNNAKLLPRKYELCDVEDIVILIADMISELIETNDNLPLQTSQLTRFHSRTPPGISVVDYLQRLAKHAALTPPLLIAMVFYIDRLCTNYPTFVINTLTVHRFLITAATVAAKGLSDSFWNNSTYARVGGIKLAELGMLELEFLYRVDWRIVPQPETLVEYYCGLVKRSDLYVLDAEADGAETEEPAEEPEVPGDRATRARWDDWMRDVAEGEGRKEEGSDAGTDIDVDTAS